LSIEIKTDFAGALKGLDSLTYKQLPFASALTLTRLAQMSQDELRSKLPGDFTLRNNWVQKGIVIEAAKKKDWPFQSAQVGSRDYFMALHAVGGIKRPKEGTNLALPRAIRPNKTDLVKRKDWPSRLLKKKGKNAPYLFTSKKGKKMVAMNLEGPSQIRNFSRIILYRFTRQSQIKRDWPIDTRTEVLVQRQYFSVFGRVLAEAIAKGKK